MGLNRIMATIFQMFQQLFSYFQTPTGTALLIIIAVAFLIIIIITIVASKRNGYLKQVKQIQQILVQEDNGLIESKLQRLQVIGQNNVVYNKVYEEQAGNYTHLKAEYRDRVSKDLEALKQILLQKNYRGASRGLKDIKIQLYLYQEKRNEFIRQLSEITKNDEELRVIENDIKANFKKCREIFSEKQSDLTIVQDVIAEKISNINDKFDLYEQQVNRGNYDDARDSLGSIANDVNSLFKSFENLPRYCQIATKYFPPKVNSIIEDCNQMQANGFPLYHIVAGAQINKIKEILTQTIQKIVAFDFANLDAIFTDLDAKINQLKQKIDEEKEARQAFDSRFTLIYNKAEELERTFIRYMSEINELNKIYDISKQAQEFSSKIKNQVNTLSITRRALDSLNYAKQPYLMRYQKMKEIEVLSSELEKMMANYKGEITNMKVVSENAYELVDQAATRLKVIELKIRNVNLDKLTLKYTREFAEGYELIAKLSKAVSASPIVIRIVDDLKSKLDAILSKIEESGNRDVGFAQYCEKLMMHANNFRASFSDVESTVSKAEILFFEARFEEAIEIVTNSVSKLGQLPFKKPVV